MISLPIPILNAVLLLLVIVVARRIDLGNRIARNAFRAVLGVIAALSVIIGLRFGYGFEFLSSVQFF